MVEAHRPSPSTRCRGALLRPGKPDSRLFRRKPSKRPPLQTSRPTHTAHGAPLSRINRTSLPFTIANPATRITRASSQIRNLFTTAPENFPFISPENSTK